MDKLEAAYAAKARAELADADVVGGAGPDSWDGPVVGTRIAFLVAHRAAPAPAAILPDRTADAVARAAEALGVADAVFVMVTRPVAGACPEDRARRLRIALESVDAPAVIALDAESAEDLASAFELDLLRPGTPERAMGRSLGFVGEFSVSLDDASAKAKAWSAMKAVAAQAGIAGKRQPPAPREAQT